MLVDLKTKTDRKGRYKNRDQRRQRSDETKKTR
jgi:hypothetical protein